jgi:hypothetical protein
MVIVEPRTLMRSPADDGATFGVSEGTYSMGGIV